MYCILNDRCFTGSQHVLCFKVLLPPDFHHFLIKPRLPDLFIELSLSILTHPLYKHLFHHVELTFILMLNYFYKHSLLVLNSFNSLFPGSEFLRGLGDRYSHEVVAEEFVGFVSTCFNLVSDEGCLGVVGFLTALDFLVALSNFVNGTVLVVNQLVLVAKVGIDDPCLHCTCFHESIHFAEDSHPVLLGSLLSIGFEAEGVVAFSHALML